MIRLALLLILMCENVNAAPQVNDSGIASDMGKGAPMPPTVAAPFTLAHPICTTGFLVAQRIDTRDRFGIIVKRQWVPGCARAPRIVYGRKV